MQLCNGRKGVWKLLPVIGGGLLVLWIFIHFNPIFEQCNALLLLLLPFAWSSANLNLPFFRSDLRVFTPKNAMLFIWLHKLVVVPIELVLIGNKASFLGTQNQSIYMEVGIVFLSFVGFLWGWQLNLLKPIKRLYASNSAISHWAIIYLIIALISLLFLYGSLIDYWKGAIFTYVTQEVLEDAGGSVLGYLANVGQRFWAFGVLLGWCWWKQQFNIKGWYWYFLWILFFMIGTLSSNRSNMLYPLLTFASVMAAHWQPRQKIWVVLGGAGLIFLSLFWGYLRVQPTLDAAQITNLFNVYTSDNDYAWRAHQLYLGTPYQITPLLYIENQTTTIWASLLDPVPIIGKAFREESGPYIYNLAIHDATIAQDQVIPVAGELYYNGGLSLLLLGYFWVGTIYRWLDAVFKKYIILNPVLAASFFYLSLLFNATLVLSLSVLVQFLLYNAAPALLIILLNWWQVRKGS